MENVKFKQVRKREHIQEIAALAINVWHATFDSILPAGQVEYMIGQFQTEDAIAKQIASNGYVYYQIKIDDELVGYFGIQISEGKLFLSKLYLDPRMQRHGLASLAIQKMKSICAMANLPSIWLTVNRHNEQAIKVYQHLGFETVREQKTDIGNGYVMDDYVMELKIENV